MTILFPYLDGEGEGGGSTPINNQDITVTQNGEYTAESGYTGLGTVTVNTPVVNNQDITVTQNGTYQAEEGYTGLGTVTVSTPVINNQNLSVTENGEYTADEGYSGLGTVTVNVPTGGGGLGTGKYSVEVYDYDGSLIEVKYLNNGDTYELPENPTREGLTFQEWVSTESVVNNAITIDKRNVLIGAVYEPTGGISEFDMIVSPNFTISFNMDGTKDWGDGTSDTSTSHTYTVEENTFVTIKCDGSTITIPSGGNSNMLGTSGTVSPHCDIMLAARLAGKVSFSGNPRPFYGMKNLKYVSLGKGMTVCPTFGGGSLYRFKHMILPSTITALGSMQYIGTFDSCEALELFISSSVTSITANCFNNCKSLSKIILPDTVTTIMGTSFTNCAALTDTDFVMPKNLTDIYGQSFSNCYGLWRINFGRTTRIPSLYNSNAFPTRAFSAIYVPDNMVDSFKAASNWSSLDIQPVSNME